MLLLDNSICGADIRLDCDIWSIADITVLIVNEINNIGIKAMEEYTVGHRGRSPYGRSTASCMEHFQNF